MALLESLGHHVEEAEPDSDGGLLSRCYMGLYFGHGAALVSEITRRTKDPDSASHPDTRALALLGRAMSAGAYVELRAHWHDFARALGALHATHELFLTPVTAIGPARIGELETPKPMQALSKLTTSLRAGKLLLEIRYRRSARLPESGTHAVHPARQPGRGWYAGRRSVHRTRFGEEPMLLRLVAQLEQASPWVNRIPDLK